VVVVRVVVRAVVDRVVVDRVVVDRVVVDRVVVDRVVADRVVVVRVVVRVVVVPVVVVGGLGRVLVRVGGHAQDGALRRRHRLVSGAGPDTIDTVSPIACVVGTGNNRVREKRAATNRPLNLRGPSHISCMVHDGAKLWRSVIKL
jgi:hypothetical protein